MKKADISGEALTGGYFLELSQRLEEPSFRTTHQLPFTVKSPKSPEPAQFAYIKNYVQQAEDALFSSQFAGPNGYAAFFELDQLIDWYLVNELFRNQDAALYSSIYLTKERGQKLNMGPVWDFDIAAGNVDYDDNFLAEGWWIQKRSPWFARFFQDPAFRAKVAARWREIRPQQVEKLLGLVGETAIRLEDSQKRNFAIWPILGKHVWPNFYVGHTYEDEVVYLESWLRARVRWLDTQWAQAKPASEPQ